MRLNRPSRVMVAVLAATGLVLTGCSDDSKKSGAKGLEKTTLHVGVVPVPDSAPLFIAKQKGYFKAEGLDVRTQPIKASPEATPKLVNGSMDLALLNYVSTFVAQDNGAARFKFVTDSYQATSRSFSLMVTKDSSMRAPKDLRGKKIAVPALKSITHLLLTASLKPYGLDDKDVRVVPIPLPSMMAALKQGSVDAIAAVEPFITNSQAQLGARILVDLVAGPTANFPSSGWGGTESFVNKNPKTVAAFQRALGRALLDARDRAVVTKTIPTYTQIPAKTATVITLGVYPTSLSATRIQRVADVLTEFGYIKARLDVEKLLVPAPK